MTKRTELNRLDQLLNEIHFNDIPVADLDTAVVWYERTFGITPTYRNYDLAILKLAAGPVLILNRSDAAPRANWSHNGETKPIIGFTTHKITQTHEHLRKTNV